MATLTSTGRSRDLHRELGPMAWAVLEDVALDATRVGRDARPNGRPRQLLTVGGPDG